MTGTYGFYFEGAYLFYCLKHKLAEWLHDHIKIILVCITEITHFIVIHGIVAIMRTKGIAAKQHFILFEISIYCVWPVQVGGTYEFKCFIAKVETVTILNHEVFKPGLKYVVQVPDGISTSHHSGIWGQFKHAHQVSGMIGFRMIEDDVFDLCRICQAPDLLNIGIPEFLLCGFHNGLFFGIDKIGVISSSVLSLHHYIESDNITIKDTNPMYIRSDLQHLIICIFHHGEYFSIKNY